jgi:4-amino-4-deoxy-L-arabinose transferase-like glycosyltransferase
MDSKELGPFIKEHIGPFITAAIILTPLIWSVTKWHYDGRIELLNQQIDQMEKNANELRNRSDLFENKSNGYKELLLSKREYVQNWSIIKTKNP